MLFFIVFSAAAPRKIIETAPVDREEEKTSETPVYEASSVRLSADVDACWLTKGKHNFFGYKSFVIVDAKQGYIEKIAVTPANVSKYLNSDKLCQDCNINDLRRLRVS